MQSEPISRDPPPIKQQVEFTPQLLAFSVVLLPCIIIFDIIAYMLQRSSCMTCGDIPAFINQSSLAAQVVGHSWSAICASWPTRR